MSVFCFIRTAELGIPDLFLSRRLQALGDEGRLHANEGVLIPVSRKMKANIIEWGLLKIISDCEVDQAVELLAFARSNEMGWTNSEVLGWYLKEFALAMIIAVLNRRADGCKRGRHGDALPGALHPKVVPRYVEKVQESGIKRIFVEVAWNRFKTESVESRTISSIKQHRAFMRDTTVRREEVEAKAGDTNVGSDFEGTLFVDEVAESRIHGKLKEIQHLCEK